MNLFEKIVTMEEITGKAVYVRGLPFDNIGELKEYFGVAGGVDNILPITDINGKFSGSAFVLYAETASVGKAIAELPQIKLKGKTLKLQGLNEDQVLLLINMLSTQGSQDVKPSQSGAVMDFMEKLTSLTPEQRQSILQILTPSATAKVEAPHVVTPRIPTFSGDDSKSDISYDQWRYEVRCLLNEDSHSEKLLLQAIRRSVRGTAAAVLLHMGESATIEAVLKKFDVIFGNILTTEQLYEVFYSAHQREGEKVAVWSCRLEELLNQIRIQGSLHPSAITSMLRSKFWMGLRDEHIKAATRHKFDGGEDYDSLFIAARTAEHEKEDRGKVVHQKKGVTSHQATVNSTSIEDKLDLILKKMEAMETRISNLEKRDSEDKQTKQSKNHSDKCQRCLRVGHVTSKCYARKDIHGHPLNDRAPAAQGPR